MRRYVKNILLFAAMLSYAQGKAQYYSQRYIVNGLNDYIISVQVADDTIYAMCQAGDSTGKNIGAFLKIDKKGIVLSTQYFDIPTRSNIGINFPNLIKTNDGGFAYGGWTAGATYSDNALLLIKYDRHGDFQWYQEIPDTNAVVFDCQAIIQDSFSNFYITGIIIHHITNDYDAYIAKTDSQGNLIYFKVFNNPNSTDAGGGLAINARGNIILGGGTGVFDANDLSKTTGYSKIYELDTAGNPLRVVIGTDSNAGGADRIILNSDGSFLTAGSYLCYKDSFMTKEYGCVIKFDSNFHEVWRLDVGPCSVATNFISHIALPDGNFLAYGIYCDSDDINMLHMKGWLVKYSGDGHLIWSREYKGISNNGPQGDYNPIYSCGFFSDSTIICAGESTDNSANINDQQGWLLHLDTIGCLPDSNSCGIVDAVTDIQRANGSVKIYPNPASDMLTMECRTDQPSEKSIQVVNMLGQIMYSNSLSAQQAELSIDVKQWAAGVYSYKVISEKGFTSSGSFVVSH